MSKGKLRAEKYFKSNTTGDVLYTTSDGTPFLRKQNAKAHASTLEDKAIETFERNAKVEEIDVDADDLSEAEKEAAKVEADKKAAAKKKSEEKKQAEAAKAASENTAGAKKHPANTGADQKTAK